MKQLKQIASNFVSAEIITDITPLGNGLINDTFLVSSPESSWVLQKINRHVFTQPELIMANLQQLSQHVQSKSAAQVRLQIPLLVLTTKQESFYLDSDNECWRGLTYIPGSFSKESVTTLADAEQIGRALGHFHQLCSDLAPELLSDTLPGFHITPLYFTYYQTTVNKAVDIVQDDAFRYCIDMIAAQGDFVSVLEDAKQRGDLKLRVMHGDPKVNNFLFDQQTQKIISLIDLDTVKPGLIHYDIGDCLRSSCQNVHNGKFELSVCQAVLSSYVQEARTFLTSVDYDYFYPAMQLIPFELGLRFFTDYLQGNRYFKVTEPQQNLQRAVQQFELCQGIQQQRTAIEAIIAGLRG